MRKLRKAKEEEIKQDVQMSNPDAGNGTELDLGNTSSIENNEMKQLSSNDVEMNDPYNESNISLQAYQSNKSLISPSKSNAQRA